MDPAANKPRYVIGDVHILGADLNSKFDIGVITYECFEIEFSIF